jgi:hypothetical protein
MSNLKTLLDTINIELYNVDGGRDRPVTVNDLRNVVTALITEINQNEKDAKARLAMGLRERVKRSQEFFDSDPTSMFDPDSI